MHLGQPIYFLSVLYIHFMGDCSTRLGLPGCGFIKKARILMVYWSELCSAEINLHIIISMYLAVM